MGKLYFIINPKAGNGNGRRVWQTVEKELQTLNQSYSSFFSEYRGHAKELADSLIGEEDHLFIVVIGGDGTLNEVINSIANNQNVRLGFIPGGSGNDFSRGFRIPREPIQALHSLLGGINSEAQQVDVGYILNEGEEKIFFINNMGAGFDALICKDVEASMIKKFLNRVSLGNLVYVFILLKRLFTYQCYDLQLTIDGKVHHFQSTWFVTIANQPYFGGGMKIAPQALTSDGILNITVVHNLSKLKLLLVFISVFWGGHVSFKEVHNFLGKNISIHTSSPALMHVDGEPIGETPANIEVSHKAISLIRNSKISRQA
ncbi:diacylglycerol/lipid kinase family protein [Bacillus massilinigeriensis]|uniref:diacylglycerol/lipid kinase family protein n=1 Tax=Bacillus massilionigeriensis TaxID=1805475 RepID=UPI00096B5B93|nr:diacylglycerol kinase family protein [Bacillus massilionigeriensis]